MALPSEVRMQIWRHLTEEEIEFDAVNNEASVARQVNHLPSNPAVPLLLLCQQARAEVVMIPRTSLIARMEEWQCWRWLGVTSAAYRSHIKFIRLRDTLAFPGWHTMSADAIKSGVEQGWKKVEIVFNSEYQRREDSDKVRRRPEERIIKLEVSEPLELPLMEVPASKCQRYLQYVAR